MEPAQGKEAKQEKRDESVEWFSGLIYGVIRFAATRFVEDFEENFRRGSTGGLLSFAIDRLKLRSDVLQYAGFPLADFDVEGSIVGLKLEAEISYLLLIEKTLWSGFFNAMPEGNAKADQTLCNFLTKPIKVSIAMVELKVRPRAIGSEGPSQDMVRSWLRSIEGSWDTHLRSLLSDWSLEEKSARDYLINRMAMLRFEFRVEQVKFEYIDPSIDPKLTYAGGLLLGGLVVRPASAAAAAAAAPALGATGGGGGESAAPPPLAPPAAPTAAVSTGGGTVFAYLPEGQKGDGLEPFPQPQDVHLHTPDLCMPRPLLIEATWGKLEMYLVQRLRSDPPFSRNEEKKPAAVLSMEPCKAFNREAGAGGALGSAREQAVVGRAILSLHSLYTTLQSLAAASEQGTAMQGQVAAPPPTSVSMHLGAFSCHCRESHLRVIKALSISASQRARKARYHREFAPPPMLEPEAVASLAAAAAARSIGAAAAAAAVQQPEEDVEAPASSSPPRSQSAPEQQQQQQQHSQQSTSQRLAARQSLLASLQQCAQLLASQRTSLGASHPAALSTAAELGGLLCRLGRHEEATPFLTTVSQARERALGMEHPDTAASFAAVDALKRSQWARLWWKYLISCVISDIREAKVAHVRAREPHAPPVFSRGVSRQQWQGRRQEYITAYIASWAHFSGKRLAVPPLMYPAFAVVKAPPATTLAGATGGGAVAAVGGGAADVEVASGQWSLRGFQLVTNIQASLSPPEMVQDKDLQDLCTPEQDAALECWQAVKARALGDKKSMAQQRGEKQQQSRAVEEERILQRIVEEALEAVAQPSGAVELRRPTLHLSLQAPACLERYERTFAEATQDDRAFLERETVIINKQNWYGDLEKEEGGARASTVLAAVKTVRLLEVEGLLTKEDVQRCRVLAQVELCARRAVRVQRDRGDAAFRANLSLKDSSVKSVDAVQTSLFISHAQRCALAWWWVREREGIINPTLPSRDSSVEALKQHNREARRKGGSGLGEEEAALVVENPPPPAGAAPRSAGAGEGERARIWKLFSWTRSAQPEEAEVLEGLCMVPEIVGKAVAAEFYPKALSRTQQDGAKLGAPPPQPSRVCASALLSNMCRTGAPASIAFLQHWVTQALGSFTHCGGATPHVATQQVLASAASFFTSGNLYASLDDEPWRKKGVFFVSAGDMAVLWDADDIERGAVGKRDNVLLPPRSFLQTSATVATEGFRLTLSIKEAHGTRLIVDCSGVAASQSDFVGGASSKAVSVAPIRAWLQRGEGAWECPPGSPASLPLPSSVTLLSDPTVFHNFSAALERRSKTGNAEERDRFTRLHKHLFVWSAAVAFSHHRHSKGEVQALEKYRRTVQKGLDLLPAKSSNAFPSEIKELPRRDVYYGFAKVAQESLQELAPELTLFASEPGLWCAQHGCLDSRCKGLLRTSTCKPLSPPPASSAPSGVDFFFHLDGLTLRNLSLPLPLCSPLVASSPPPLPPAHSSGLEERLWWRSPLPPLSWPSLVPALPLTLPFSRTLFPLHSVAEPPQALPPPPLPHSPSSSHSELSGQLGIFPSPLWPSPMAESLGRAFRCTRNTYDASKLLAACFSLPPVSAPAQHSPTGWILCPRVICDRNSRSLLTFQSASGDTVWTFSGEDSKGWRILGGQAALLLWRLTVPASVEAQEEDDPIAVAALLESRGFVITSLGTEESLHASNFLSLLQGLKLEKSPSFLLCLAPSAIQRDGWVEALRDAEAQRIAERAPPPKSQRMKPKEPFTCLELGRMSVTVLPSGVQSLQRMASRVPEQTSGELSELQTLGKTLAASAKKFGRPPPLLPTRGAYRQDIFRAGAHVAYISALQSVANRSVAGGGQRGGSSSSSSPAAIAAAIAAAFPIFAPKPTARVTLPCFRLLLPLSPRRQEKEGGISALVIEARDLAITTLLRPSHLLNSTGLVLGEAPASPWLYTPASTLTLGSLTCQWEDSAMRKVAGGTVLEAEVITLSQTSMGGCQARDTWQPHHPDPSKWLPASVQGCSCERVKLSPLSNSNAAAALLSVWKKYGKEEGAAEPQLQPSQHLGAAAVISPPTGVALLCVKAFSLHFPNCLFAVNFRDLRARHCAFSTASHKASFATFAALEVVARQPLLEEGGSGLAGGGEEDSAAIARNPTRPLLAFTSNGPLPAIAVQMCYPAAYTCTTAAAQDDARVQLQTVALCPCPAFVRSALSAANHAKDFAGVLEARAREEEEEAARERKVVEDAAIAAAEAAAAAAAADSASAAAAAAASEEQVAAESREEALPAAKLSRAFASPMAAFPPSSAPASASSPAATTATSTTTYTYAHIPAPHGFLVLEKPDTPTEASACSPWMPLNRGTEGHCPLERSAVGALDVLLPPSSKAKLELEVGFQSWSSPMPSASSSTTSSSQTPHQRAAPSAASGHLTSHHPLERYDGHVAQLTQWRHALAQGRAQSASLHCAPTSDSSQSGARVGSAAEPPAASTAVLGLKLAVAEVTMDLYGSSGSRLLTGSVRGLRVCALSSPGLALPSLSWDSFRLVCLDAGDGGGNGGGGAAQQQARALPPLLPPPSMPFTAWSGVEDGVLVMKGGCGAASLTAGGSKHFLLHRLSVTAEPDPRDLPPSIRQRFYPMRRGREGGVGTTTNSSSGGPAAGGTQWAWTPGSLVNSHLVKEIFALTPVAPLSMLRRKSPDISTGETAAKALALALSSPAPDLAHVAFSSTPTYSDFGGAGGGPQAAPYFPALLYEAYHDGSSAAAKAPTPPPTAVAAASGEHGYQQHLSSHPSLEAPSAASAAAATSGRGTRKLYFQPSSFAHVSIAAVAVTADALCLSTVKRLMDSINGAVGEFSDPAAAPPPPPSSSALSGSGSEGMASKGSEERESDPPPTLQMPAPSGTTVSSQGAAASTYRGSASSSVEAHATKGSTNLIPNSSWDHVGVELGVCVINLCILPTLAGSSSSDLLPPTSSAGVSLPLATIIMGRTYCSKDAASHGDTVSHQKSSRGVSADVSSSWMGSRGAASGTPLPSQHYRHLHHHLHHHYNSHAELPTPSAQPVQGVFAQIQGMCIHDASPGGVSLRPEEGVSGNSPSPWLADKFFRLEHGDGAFGVASSVWWDEGCPISGTLLYERACKLLELQRELGGKGLATTSQPTEDTFGGGCALSDPHRPYRAIMMPRLSPFPPGSPSNVAAASAPSASASIAGGLTGGPPSLPSAASSSVLPIPGRQSLPRQEHGRFRAGTSSSAFSKEIQVETACAKGEGSLGDVAAPAAPPAASSAFSFSSFTASSSAALPPAARPLPAGSAARPPQTLRHSHLNLTGSTAWVFGLDHGFLLRHIPARVILFTPWLANVLQAQHALLKQLVKEEEEVGEGGVSVQQQPPQQPYEQLGATTSASSIPNSQQHPDATQQQRPSPGPSVGPSQDSILFNLVQHSHATRPSARGGHLSAATQGHFHHHASHFHKLFRPLNLDAMVPMISLSYLMPLTSFAAVPGSGPSTTSGVKKPRRETTVFNQLLESTRVDGVVRVDHRSCLRGSDCYACAHAGHAAVVLSNASLVYPKSFFEELQKGAVPQLTAALAGGGGASWAATYLDPSVPPPIPPRIPPTLSFNFNTVLVQNLKVLVPMSSSGRPACALPTPPGAPPGACLVVGLPCAVIWNSLRAHLKEESWDENTLFERMEIIVCGGDRGGGMAAATPSGSGGSGGGRAAPALSPPHLTVALALPADYVRQHETTSLVSGMGTMGAEMAPFVDATEIPRYMQLSSIERGGAQPQGPRMAQPLCLGVPLVTMGLVKVSMVNPLSGTNLATVKNQSVVTLQIGLDTLRVNAPSMEQVNLLNGLKASNFAEPTPFNTFPAAVRPPTTPIFKVYTAPSSQAIGRNAGSGSGGGVGGEGVAGEGGANQQEAAEGRFGELTVFLREVAFPPTHASMQVGTGSAGGGATGPPREVAAPASTGAAAAVPAIATSAPLMPRPAHLSTLSTRPLLPQARQVEEAESAALESLIKGLLQASIERALKQGGGAAPASFPSLSRTSKLKYYLERMRVANLTCRHARSCTEEAESSGGGASNFFKGAVSASGAEQALACAAAALLHISSSLDTAAAVAASNAGSAAGFAALHSGRGDSGGALGAGSAKDLLPVIAAYLGAISKVVAEDKAAAAASVGSSGVVSAAAAGAAAAPPPSSPLGAEEGEESPEAAPSPTVSMRAFQAQESRAATLAALKVSMEGGYLLPILEGAHLCAGLAFGSSLFLLTVALFFLA
jgi:hypothetical protein